MRRQWTLTQEAFDTLLAWFDPDRERAALKYESIRQGLVKLFTWRGFSEAEDMADETINRVNQKVGELAKTYQGDPALYFYGVAKKLMLEVSRQERPVSLPAAAAAPPASDTEERERIHECLEACLAQLPADDRTLILSYYQEARRVKIDSRKEMSRLLGVTPNTLRVRLHRLRLRIQDCVARCLREPPPDETK
jgi:RNA polymerase sigma factor (sigma-70 family)